MNELKRKFENEFGLSAKDAELAFNISKDYWDNIREVSLDDCFFYTFDFELHANINIFVFENISENGTSFKINELKFERNDLKDFVIKRMNTLHIADGKRRTGCGPNNILYPFDVQKQAMIDFLGLIS